MSKLCIVFFNDKWFKTGLDFDSNNGNIPDRFVPVISLGLFNLMNNIHAFNHLSKNNVSAVQPRSFLEGDEKLGSIVGWAQIQIVDGIKRIHSSWAGGGHPEHFEPNYRSVAYSTKQHTASKVLASQY